MIKTRIFIVILLLALSLPSQTLPAQASSIEYYSPISGAGLIPAQTTLTFRFSEKLDLSSLTQVDLQAQGSISGSHPGRLSLCDDQRTVIFQPDRPFTPSETVTVTVSQVVQSSLHTPLLSFSFSISPGASTPTQPFALAETPPVPQQIVPLSVSPYLTTPTDLPVIDVTTPANNTADGDLFVSNFAADPTHNYLMILDNNGEPIYYQKVPNGAFSTDFKRLPNGNLSYWDQQSGAIILLDSTYRVIDTIHPGNGYTSVDAHEFLQLPNGHCIFLIYDTQPVDMSHVTPGGDPHAQVTGAIIQELDTHKNVVFQWRSWDHFAITDTNQPLTTDKLDYVHANALDLDLFGNILLSSRHMSEITKIDHQTGAIIWRMGGVQNQFTFASTVSSGEPVNFYYQHDIRYLPNGHISLFDNHDDPPPQISRGLEYAVNESTLTATLVNVIRNTPDVYSSAMGNVQHLSNGNTLVGWGSNPSPNLTEFHADGSKAIELTIGSSNFNYRAYRFPWHGYPTWAPQLIARSDGGGGVNLTVSWNGATDISAYQVYGSDTLPITTFIKQQNKSGFETTINLTSLQSAACLLRIMPLDTQGKFTQFSNLAFNPGCVKSAYFPFIGN
jgi:hypothetical protein